MDYDEFVADVAAIGKEYDLEVSWPHGDPSGAARITPINTPWYKTIEASLSQWGAKVQPAIFPAATDSRYLRHVGVPAFGFSPMRNLVSTLHEHNEFLPRSTYIEGIAVYQDLIPKLANLPAEAFA